jgi:hypothetical protein
VKGGEGSESFGLHTSVEAVGGDAFGWVWTW